MDSYSSISHSLRLHAGADALKHLPRELGRLNARRAFILCGQSVATRTPLLHRLRELLGASCAGAYTRIGKDAPLQDVLAAVDAARASEADLLIAVGAGSVLKAARVAAILLAESGDPLSLATQYAVGMPPVSPRLLKPKLPLINVLTAATSAQNRSGAALRAADGGARLEFFDPKTRPAAIFWDSEALLTAPPSLAASTGVAVFWRSLMNAGAIRGANPLVQASRLHAYALARQALPRLHDPRDAQARLDMCAAALLQNRDEDDGGRPFDAHWIARVVYALGAALFNRYAHLDQGATHAILTGPAILCFGDLCPEAVQEMSAMLGLPASAVADPSRLVAAIDELLRPLGLPARLSDLSVPADGMAAVIDAAMFNFNADRERELSRHRDRLADLLRQAL
ncbi:iron-containing alcohol dehydrogenase [Achromobacter pestifer]|uniref:Iron-containing alcohol dehydrogenase n=1 Tax=Achromobacter pestifer TaxID=1353889 RepID=A0A7D4E1S6_9BURK|nr:iron-containing alcohol dehydrogenase family protein [Achromobacter pestifer]QKH36909.1 iron-containing alcohol dehydrogenase [Achromobacter pestifer]